MNSLNAYFITIGSIEEIEIIQNLPMKYQLNMIKAIGKNTSKFRRKLLELSELYEKEDLKSLYKRTMKGSGGMKRILLYERNEIMTDSIFFFWR